MSDPTPPTPQPHHRLRLRAQIGALPLAVDLTLTAPWTVVFGPSGSGKSSLLRAIAGLLSSAEINLERRNTHGAWQTLSAANLSTSRRSESEEHVLLSGARSAEPKAPRISSRTTPTPPRARHIAYAPQQPSLFPHLTVAANVAFAQQSSHKSTTSQQNINTSLQLFHLEDLAHRYPRNLSGGEQQRVNLARAFAVPNPQLLLLDEPFTGIGRALRDELLPAMRRWAADRRIPVLSVTHDVEEALQLQAEVIRLEEGRILTQGPAHEVLRDERLSILKTLS